MIASERAIGRYILLSFDVSNLGTKLIWVELKHFSVNLGFLANYVLSNDFCFFPGYGRLRPDESSRKRRIKTIAFLLSLSFHKAYIACLCILTKYLHRTGFIHKPHQPRRTPFQ